MKPKLLENVASCSRCDTIIDHHTDTVSLCTNDIRGFQIPIITWCKCGKIKVNLQQGMDVEVVRA